MADWRIVRTIDEGGFGKVYEVKGIATGQKAALKELKHLDRSNLIRFQREINIIRDFEHPNIIEIYDYNVKGSDSIGPYYIMEYMEGGSLRTLMNETFQSKKTFNTKLVLNTVILPVIDAIEYAHSEGVYHRDLKPENLLFATIERNYIKVLDWGIGKDINRDSIALTIGGLGTPGYCSPEQWFANAPVDGRTDIYSLGVIFYELLTGEIPQLYDNSGRTFSVPLPSSRNASVSQHLDTVILKMMAYLQADRYQTIDQVYTALSIF
ncbi:Serine/threonine-protein kinase StkP [termite gut metagenome]|uniref:Serine/threonine-protein kinase StkP n=1 Tax=termite gut metagenome TaxID=433724 RepID=A0A5J4S9J3_9ZZZZ